MTLTPLSAGILKRELEWMREAETELQGQVLRAETLVKKAGEHLVERRAKLDEWRGQIGEVEKTIAGAASVPPPCVPDGMDPLRFSGFSMYDEGERDGRRLAMALGLHEEPRKAKPAFADITAQIARSA